MGLLDDAIREHLDLKRRRGADPTEVDQLEREALGPVRRGPQVSDEPLPGEEHLNHDEHFEHDEHLEHDEAFDNHGPFGSEEPFDEQHSAEREGSSTMLYDDQAEGTLETSARPAPAPERGVADEPQREERSWSYDSEEEWEGDKSAEAADAPSKSAEAPPPAEARRPAPPPDPTEEADEHAGQETVEYDVEGEHKREEKDDVLEETPEFLQDTPDHDRLWFEQRPPRPFDFEK
jgi:hypothetical protein